METKPAHNFNVFIVRTFFLSLPITEGNLRNLLKLHILPERFSVTIFNLKRRIWFITNLGKWYYHNIQVFQSQSFCNSGFSYRSVISYETIKEPLRSVDVIANNEKILSYDDVDHEVVRSYQEFALANTIFAAMKDGAASEQSARMTAMDNASKNAGTYSTFNRVYYLPSRFTLLLFY